MCIPSGRRRIHPSSLLTARLNSRSFADRLDPLYAMRSACALPSRRITEYNLAILFVSLAAPRQATSGVRRATRCVRHQRDRPNPKLLNAPTCITNGHQDVSGPSSSQRDLRGLAGPVEAKNEGPSKDPHTRTDGFLPLLSSPPETSQPRLSWQRSTFRVLQYYGSRSRVIGDSQQLPSLALGQAFAKPCEGPGNNGGALSPRG